jgi:hypothetical protein
MPTNYTFDELYGAGTSSIDLINYASYTFTITNNSGSSYFVMETTRNSQQAYDSSSPQNLVGELENFSNINLNGVVTSSYIAGFSLSPGVNSFDYIPFINVLGSTLKFRGTGGITLSIGDPIDQIGRWGLFPEPWNVTTSSWEQEIN